MEFIDQGDECNDPPESVGSYDLDDRFINDASDTEEEISHHRRLLNLHMVEEQLSPIQLQGNNMRSMQSTPGEMQPIHTGNIMFLSEGELEQPVNSRRRRESQARMQTTPDSDIVMRRGRSNETVQSPGSVSGGRRPDNIQHRRLAQRERSRERDNPVPTGRRPGARKRAQTRRKMAKKHNAMASRGTSRNEPAGADQGGESMSMEDAVHACTHKPGTRLGRPNSFRLSCRRVFLTYSQVPDGWDPQSLLDRLEELGAKYRIGRELHQDGGVHYHAYVDFVNKRDFGRADYFDINGHHPNIRSVWKTPEYVFDYAGKDGDIVACTTERPDPLKGASARQEAWGPVHTLERSEEVYEAISKIDPRAAILSFPAISQFMDRKEKQFRRSKIRPYENPPGLVINWEDYPELRHWVLGSLPDGASRIRRFSRPGWEYTGELEAEDKLHVPRRVKGGRVKSLILWGPTQLGKTIAARAFGRHGYMCLNFNLEKLLDLDINTLEYVIWDDISWNSSGLNNDQYKGWFGCQKELDVSDKYLHKHTITWGKPVVFNTNHNPEFGISHVDMDWLNGNCITIGVKEGVPIATCDLVYETDSE